MRIITWDENETKQQIMKRWKNASNARRPFEDKWLVAERIMYSTSGLTSPAQIVDGSLENIYQTGLPGADGSNVEMNAAYVFKNIRFIHAQMSSNPPSVAMRPTTSDQDDGRKADAADKICRWAIRQYSMQEMADQRSLQCLTYGTGFLKFVYDSTKGDIIDWDSESGEVKLEGDLSVNCPFIWNIFMDPDGKSWNDCKYVFERIYVDYDEACQQWPDKLDYLKKARIEGRDGPYKAEGRETNLVDNHYNCVELLEYWETGLPTNGYLGRFCITTLQGDVVEPCRPSPCRFRRAGSVDKVESSNKPDEIKQKLLDNLPEMARLPYSILTDIDIPNCIYGKSAIDYAFNLQENLTRLDSSVLDNVALHGVARMVVPDSTEVDDESLSDNPIDVIKITGNQPPYFMGVPQLMPEMSSTRQNLLTGLNDIMGVNEAMFGQQSREQSGASMQYATNQGNMIRRRLFNKYVLAVETDYKLILDHVRKHWSINRTISVIGKEKALEAIDLKGADIDGGYDIVGEYGTNLSLDPVSRRQEIIALQPMFEKAGIPPRKSLELMKLNDLEGMFDRLELAGLRQKEIFDLIIGTGSYIKPKPFRDHENMIAWAMDYFMTQEFESLEENIQQLCEQHIQERAQVAATEKPGTAPTQPPGPAPAGGLPANLPPPAAGPIPAPGT